MVSEMSWINQIVFVLLSVFLKRANFLQNGPRAPGLVMNGVVTPTNGLINGYCNWRHFTPINRVMVTYTDNP